MRGLINESPSPVLNGWAGEHRCPEATQGTDARTRASVPTIRCITTSSLRQRSKSHLTLTGDYTH